MAAVAARGFASNAKALVDIQSELRRAIRRCAKKRREKSWDAIDFNLDHVQTSRVEC